jgi:pathogenesis-related protein 1
MVGVLIVGTSHAQAPALVVSKIELAPFTDKETADFVKAHNEARQAVGSPPLEWSDDLAKFSAEWLTAQRDAMKTLAQQGQFPNPGHRPADGPHKQKYGENLAIWGGSADSVASAPEKAVAGWLKEKTAFDKLQQVKPYVVGAEQGQVDETGRPMIVGHYTQVVWKKTKRVGAARIIVEVSDDQNRKLRSYVGIVANYDPPGNFVGEKPY